MAFLLSPISNGQQVDANGAPLSGGTISTYLAGSSTPAPTYTDITGATPQTNPIVLTTLGATPNPIWLDSTLVYKFIIKDSLGNLQRTIDNVSGISSSVPTQSQWVIYSGTAPTYLSATSLSLPGDQTVTLHVGRRITTTNTGGVVYSSILTSVFSAGVTTLTLSNDSGSLDAGLSQLSYALLSANGPSVPASLTTPLITPLTLNAPLVMNGSAVQFASSNVAATATTSNIWGTNRVMLTGAAVTFTNFAAAPQAGAWTELYCNAAHTFTYSANMLVDGGVSYTATIGDRIFVRAQTTTVFELFILSVARYASTTAQGISRLSTLAEAQAGSLSTVGVTPAGLNSAVFGMGQTYQDMTASRASGTTYTNSTGRAIAVSMWNTSASAGTQTIACYVNGVLIQNNITTPGAAGATNIAYFVVPPGATYSITFNSTLTKWFELR